MSYKPRYDKGDWIADCDVCGRKYKASMLRQRWDGLMCCDDDWEIRQPQDYVRGVADIQTTPWTRPEPQDQFIVINFTPPAVTIPVNQSASLSIKVILYDTSKQELDAEAINVKPIG